MNSVIGQPARIASMIRAAIATQQGAKQQLQASKARPSRSTSQPRDLKSLIATRLESIAEDDPERNRKIFRAFLEASLLAELGEQLVSDPLFANMVDAVQEQMYADEEIAAWVRQAVQSLTAPTSGTS